MSGDTINSDLIRGNIDTIILRALYEGDRYGYDILKEIEQRSKGRYKLKQPTLYSCLKRLETQGFIKSYWGAKSIGGRRKYFTLTDMGREIFVRNKADWEYSRTLIDALISMGDDTLSGLYNSNNGNQTDDINQNPDNDESFTEDDLECFDEDHENNDSDTTDSESSADKENSQDEKPYCDAVVFIDEDLPENNDDTNGDDKEIDLKYTSDYREKQSYIGTMRDKTYTPEKADKFSDFQFPESFKDYEIDNISEKELSDDSNESYHEHGEITNPIDFASKNSSSSSVNNDETKSVESKKPEFYNYHSDVGTIQNVEIPQSDGTSLLNKLDEKAKYKPTSVTPITESVPPQTSPKPIHNDPIITEEIEPANNEFPQKIKIRKFATITKTLSDISEKHEEIPEPELNKKYYYPNRLALRKYAYLFGLMLFEIIACFCLIQYVFKSNPAVTQSDLAIYILSVVFAAAFPLVAAVVCRYDYNKRKRIEFKLWVSIAYRLIFMVQALLIIYALNIYIGMPLMTSEQYYVSLILPAVLSTNIPIAGLIFYKLLNSGKYNIGG